MGLRRLWDHGLEAAVVALELRGAYLLPPGHPDRDHRHRKPTYGAFACFAAILLHDIGKPAMDQEVELFSNRGEALGLWDQ